MITIACGLTAGSELGLDLALVG